LGVLLVEDYTKTFGLVLELVKKDYSEDYTDKEMYKAVDKAVNTVHNEEVKAVLITSKQGESKYCNQCGYCCREYGIILRPEDIYNLSKTVDITGNIVHEGMVYRFNERPCRYLESDGRCGCYDSRPLTCRNHPLTSPEQPRIIRDPECTYILRLLSDIAVSMLTGEPFGR
jgi:Fe-S-cluster containining protein